jgi:hypothetical protein
MKTKQQKYDEAVERNLASTLSKAKCGMLEKSVSTNQLAIRVGVKKFDSAKDSALQQIQAAALGYSAPQQTSVQAKTESCKTDKRKLTSKEVRKLGNKKVSHG